MMNIGWGEDVTIREPGELALSAIGYNGRVEKTCAWFKEHSAEARL
jgi:hypothetical protein